MGCVERTGRTAALATAVLALMLLGGGCSNMPGAADVKLLPKLNEVLPRRSVSANQESASANKSVTAADLVDSQGMCAGAAASADGEAALPSAQGVGLFMTECQVVQVLGVPQAIDISKNPRGEREVTMTFLTSSRAGLYRFVSGRLKSIERAPDAEPEPTRSRNRRSPT